VHRRKEYFLAQNQTNALIPLCRHHDQQWLLVAVLHFDLFYATMRSSYHPQRLLQLDLRVKRKWLSVLVLLVAAWQFNSIRNHFFPMSRLKSCHKVFINETRW